MQSDPSAATDTSMVPEVGPAKSMSVPTERLTSIDALRGFDMFWIVGRRRCREGSGQMVGYAGEQELRRAIRARRMGRVPVLRSDFPAVPVHGRRGLAVLAAQVPDRRSAESGCLRPARATGSCSCSCWGLIYNNLLRFDFANLRVTGVLQRIAICYGIAAVIFLLTKVRTQVILFVAILVGYWAILMYVPAPESHKAGDFSMETNLAGYLDRHYPAGQDLQVFLRFRRQRGIALDDPGGGDGPSWRTGRPVAALEPGSLDQGPRPGGWRARLPGHGHALGTRVSDHQDPLDQHLCSDRGRLEPALARALLHDHRRAQAPRLGLLLRRHRRQCDHHLRRVADHPV